MKNRPEGVIRRTETPKEYCKKITKERAKNFYWAIILLPKEKRSAVYSIYTFARRCDDIADSNWEVSRKKDRLHEVRENLDRLYRKNPRGKLYEALSTTVENYSIPRTYFDQLIRGVEMDLVNHSYSTFDDLKVYCFRVASVVGLSLIEVFGYSDSVAKKYAIDLGIGMQLTNIIRDVAEDYRRDRIYIPEEDLEEFNCDFSEIHSSGTDPQFKNLMGYQADRARDYFNSGKELFSYLSPRSRACPAGLYGVYSTLLDKMENSGWNIWDQRAELSTLKKIGAVLSQWLTSLNPQ
ncbi:MAG: phytoene/squalene synthase family protein [Candidatus Bipolaricaulota bacterium]